MNKGKMVHTLAILESDLLACLENRHEFSYFTSIIDYPKGAAVTLSRLESWLNAANETFQTLKSEFQEEDSEC